jgi:VanZ family protein
VQGLPALGRSTSLADWVADAVGILVGLALWEFASRRPRAPR